MRSKQTTGRATAPSRRTTDFAAVREQLDGGAPGGPMQPADGEAEFTRYSAIETCPRCDAETFRQPECRTCGLPISDAVIDEALERGRKRRRGQILALSALLLAAFVQVEGMALGYALGARANTVTAQRVQRASDDETRRVFRTLRPQARFEFQAAQLANRFNRAFLPVETVRFNRRQIPGQPAPSDPLTADVTYVTATDAVWKTLSREEREALLVDLAAGHAWFLGLAGAQDTTHFAAVISVLEQGPADTERRERILAVRDRAGRTLFK